MKKTTDLLTVFSFSLFFGFIPLAESSETMRFSSIQNSGPQEVAKLVIHEAYERIGIQTQFRDLPAIRALEEANSGKTDGEIARLAGVNKEFENLIRIPIVVSELRGVAFTKKKDFKLKEWDSLKNHQIGALLGSKFVENKDSGLNIKYVPSVENLFTMLKRNRLDFIILPHITGLNYIKENSLVGINALTPALSTVQLYHYLNKKHEKLIPSIIASLEEMRDAGLIEFHRDSYVLNIATFNTLN